MIILFAGAYSYLHISGKVCLILWPTRTCRRLNLTDGAPQCSSTSNTIRGHLAEELSILSAPVNPVSTSKQKPL